MLPPFEARPGRPWSSEGSAAAGPRTIIRAPPLDVTFWRSKPSRLRGILTAGGEDVNASMPVCDRPRVSRLRKLCRAVPHEGDHGLRKRLPHRRQRVCGVRQVCCGLPFRRCVKSSFGGGFCARGAVLLRSAGHGVFAERRTKEEHECIRPTSSIRGSTSG